MRVPGRQACIGQGMRRGRNDAVDNSANKDDVVKKTTTGGDIQFDAIKSVKFDNCILSQLKTCEL